jgi:prefoldin subunit 5
MAPEQEITGLKQQAEYFQNALGDINKRIEELESQKTSKD